jgi:predicted PhzF superfamily epimerase YddE/YHI9
VPLATAAAPRPAPAGTDDTQCLTWPESDAAIAVECATGTGRAITFCGHGLLGAAAYWQDRGHMPQRLAMSGAVSEYLHESGVGWISSDALSLAPATVPAWAGPLLDNAPVACVEAGDEGGYLVVEWPQDTDLTRLDSPGDGLGQHTRRALIATCRVSPAHSLAGEDVHLRYFAPQYGVCEDVATGSAMRVLASYWHARGLGDCLQGLQRSARGGWLFSRLQGARVWIGGIVRRSEAGA